MSYLSMAEMTSPRFAALDEGHAIGLISAGATEQHGPHLPLATDTIIVTRLVHEIASRIAIPVVVAPPLPIGISQHHLGFAGTVHVPEPAFAECMRAYVRAMRDGGVRQVALISSHGGNFACLGKVAAEYASDPDVSVIAFDDLPRYATIMAAAAAAAGLAVPGSDIHAGGLETSQMLHLWRPDDIPMDPPPEGYVDAEPGWLDRLFADGVRALSETGILGRPAGARSDVGRAICDALADELAAWIATSFSTDPHPVGDSLLAG